MVPAMHALILTLLLAAPPPSTTTTVLVLPLSARGGVSHDVAETLTESVVTTLRRVPHFKVIAFREVEAAMTQEQRRQVQGCDSESCAAEIGGALNADEIVVGSVGRVGREAVLTISRVVTRTGRSAGSTIRRSPAEQEDLFLDEITPMIAELSGTPLAPMPRASKPRPVVTASIHAPAAPAQKRIAVLYFDNTGKNAELDVLSKGLADMLITDLAQAQSVRVVEREKMEAVLAELKLQRTSSFDPATAQQLGKMLGAEYLLVGSYFELLGTFRIDARLIRVDRMEVVLTQGLNGKKDEFMTMENTLAMKMVDALDVPVTPDERNQIITAEGGTFADAMDYSRAVQAADKGDKEKARVTLASLSERLPLFKPAQLLLARVQGAPK